jgi:hypothetical protein
MKRGSDWIKCDLHIHSPASSYHQYGDRNDPAVWERFIKELEALPPEFKIIGINDYLTVDGYERIVAAKEKGRLPNIDCILPVVEFRLNRLVGNEKTKRINYHVIFSDAVEPDTIRNQFFPALSASYRLEAGEKHPTWSGILSEESLKLLGKQIKSQSPGVTSLQAESDWEVGFNNFNVDYQKLKEALAFTAFTDKVITAIGKVEWEQFKWDGGGAGEKRNIINEANLVFTAANSVSAYNTSRKSLTDQKVNDLLLDCSDAHYFCDSTQPNRIGNCFTWIKAEPTFDGLRQILFEPENRVSISETNPDKKPPYQIIERIRFVGGGEAFGNQEIRVSPYLTSIIGGKSTGKSLLAGLIVKSADIQEYRRRNQSRLTGGVVDPLAWMDQALTSMNFEVIWRDGTTTTLKNSESRKVTYFPQHYLNTSINDQGVGNKELNKIIRSVLAQNPSYGGAFDVYRNKLQELSEEIAAAATGFENSLREMREKRVLASEKGKSADVQANIDKLEGEFKDLKKKFDLSEEEIAQHAELSQKLEQAKEEKEATQVSLTALDAVTGASLSEVVQLDAVLPFYASDELIAEVKLAIAPAVATFQTAILESLKPIRIKHADKLEKANELVLKTEMALKSILDKIASSGPLSEMATVIQVERAKLTSIVALESELSALQTRIGELATQLNGFIEKRLALASDVMNVKEQLPQSGDGELKIEIRPYVKAVHVRDLLHDRVRYISNPEIRALAQDVDPMDEDFNNYSTAVATVVQQSIDGVLEFKGEHKLAGLIQELLGNSIYLNYNLMLGEDSFSIMSPGKRALALLRVIIELDASEHPIVLDQPEDDLDNRSIYDGLATYLKIKKQSRQIIVVTHNPNVVVGGDSEYVIVANQTGQESNRDNENYRFEYVYGGLEQSYLDGSGKWVLYRHGIREHVCEILDGGMDAFRRREQLYSTVKGQS